jgi:hypothetical protein
VDLVFSPYGQGLCEMTTGAMFRVLGGRVTIERPRGLSPQEIASLTRDAQAHWDQLPPPATTKFFWVNSHTRNRD